MAAMSREQSATSQLVQLEKDKSTSQQEVNALRETVKKLKKLREDERDLLRKHD